MLMIFIPLPPNFGGQEWSSLADGSDASSPPCTWVHVGDHAERHDPSHLVTHRVGMSLQALLSLIQHSMAVSDPDGSGSGSRSTGYLSPSGGGEYLSLLLALDAVASREIDAALAALPANALSEPLVARQLSRQLPPGHGLFLGNSMPIRDMDMYGAPRDRMKDQQLGSGPSDASIITLSTCGGALTGGGSSPRGGGAGVGVPIGANRGASGIDGVLSTAAGESIT